MLKFGPIAIKNVVCLQWSRYGLTSISHLLAISLKDTATQQMFKRGCVAKYSLYDKASRFSAL